VFLEGEAAWRLVRLGRLEEAEALVERALPASVGGLSTVVLRVSAAQIAIVRGGFDEADEHLAVAREQLAGMSDSMWLGPAGHGGAEAAAWAGDPERAWQDATRALAGMETEYVFYSGRVHAVAARAAADLAERALAARDPGTAAEMRARAERTLERMEAMLAPERWPDGPPPADSLGYGAMIAAEVARASGTPEPLAWAAAAGRMESVGYRFDAAYCRWRQAEALLAVGGDRSAAGELLACALEPAVAMGAGPLRREIEGLAQRARIPLGGAAPAAGAGELERLRLTEREHAVLALVAEGRTNREIGETLFISEKTASVHVSRILSKLGVRSRVEAATAAHRLGIGA
jgi:DNA-binding CsgD family transcriptional regulator